MLIRMIEVYEDGSLARATAQLINKQYLTRTILINPEHVICAREDYQMKKMLTDGLLPSISDKSMEFTKIIMDRGANGVEISVVGSINDFWLAINNVKKDLLRG